MGKRSSFERRPQDDYPTPFKAVVPLVPHLEADGIHRFVEPCAGDHQLINHLHHFGFECAFAGDLQHGFNAQHVDREWFRAQRAEAIVTNPPWTRDVMHALISAFLRASPLVWLLLDADWSHTVQSGRHMIMCTKIVPIGRVKWIADSASTGKDNACWYRFARNFRGKTEFVPRLDEVV